MHPYIIIAALATLIASHAGAFFYGQHVEEAERSMQELHTAIKYAEVIVARQETVDALEADLEAARARQKPKDRIITKEVVRYETIVAPARRCELDGAWRLLHDAAATGEPAETARLVDGSTPAVGDAAALDTVAGNYEQCRGYIEQVRGWQRFWGTVEKSYRPSSP